MVGMDALFSPINVGKLMLKNRLVMAPMALHYANEKGMLSERHINYYVARAKGGIGLIISETNYVTPDGRGGVHRLGLYEERMILDHRKLTEAVHQGGGLIFAQLHHGGSTVTPAVIGQIPVSASTTPLMVKGEPYIGTIPRKLSSKEIREIVVAFGEAARRAKEAGFDGVQVLAGHGYLINEFLSPHNNRRKDDYGGSKENRARILVEVVEAVRKQVGDDYPLSVRLTGREYLPDGYGIEFTCWLIKQLENEVDEFSIAGGNYDERDWMVSPVCVPEGFQVDQSAEVKKVTQKPVSIVGRITDPTMADRIIREGRADLIYMGRAMIADPDLPNKAREGRLDEIRPCIGCNRGCIDRLFKGLDVRCTVNPEVGREGECFPAPTDRPKKVIVVGGGPAGMEAAKVAALRGHRVTIVERDSDLGGNVRLAVKPPFRKGIDKFRLYQVAQLSKTGVELKKGITATASFLNEMKPDAVIVATGSKPVKLDIPGASLEHVVSAEDVLSEHIETGPKVVIIGGGIIGLETAEFLVERGRQVTVVEMTDVLAGDEEGMSKKMLLLRLNEWGVRIYVNCRVEYITRERVMILRPIGTEILSADTVVVAVGYKPNRDLLSTLDMDKFEIYVIGDCKEARTILEAVYEGARVGQKI